MSGPGFSFVPTTSTSGASGTYTGTANQVIVTGTVLSTPQDIATTSTPQFGGLGIGIAAACNKLRLAAAGIIDFDNGDVTFTHSNNQVEIAGGSLSVAAGATFKFSGAAGGSSNFLDFGSSVVMTQYSSATADIRLTAGAAQTWAWGVTSNAFKQTSTGRLTFGDGATVADANIDTTISRWAPGTTRFGTTAANAAGCIAFTNCTNYGCGQYAEMASAPQGNCNLATVYAVDNGAGKTQLMVVFQTGSPVEIAIEP